MPSPSPSRSPRSRSLCWSRQPRPAARPFPGRHRPAVRRASALATSTTHRSTQPTSGHGSAMPGRRCASARPTSSRESRTASARSTSWCQLAHTRRVDGVRTRVVEDRLYLDGRAGGAHERLLRPGPLRQRLVLRRGHRRARRARAASTSTEGSFHAGRRRRPARGVHAGAPAGRPAVPPGVVRAARPRTPSARSLAARASRVPYGTFHARAAHRGDDGARARDVLDNKYYVRGIGVVREVTVRGGTEELRLVNVLR